MRWMEGVRRSVVLVAVSLAAPAVWAAAVGLWLWWGGGPWSWIAPFVWAAVGTVLLARPICRVFRAVVGKWAGIEIPDGYRPLGPVTQLSTGFWWNGRSYHRTAKDARQELWWRTRLTDPAIWRDLRFLAVAPFTVGLIAPFTWRIIVPLAERFLRPSPTDRVEELTVQRADLTVTQAAELRRIERDLHDGAQARLVALGMSLATAERLLKTNPEQAVELLREARAGAATSLAELRDLVRGISPPVLTERGLVDAVRELALDCPLDAVVEADPGPRPEPPIEAALYFGVAELIANAAKHAHATRLRISLTRDAGRLVVDVEDNGRGGAVAAGDGGLAGLRRRLAAFDGRLEITSPPGGPTHIRLTVPHPP